MKPVFTKLKNGLSAHSPEIFTGVGIAGMLSGTALAVKATPKAMALIEERCKEEGVDELSFFEKVKTVWKCYLPAAITSLLSSGCILSGLSVNLRRNAGLAVATSVAETTLREYRSKIREIVGEEKEKEVMAEAAKERAEKAPVDIPRSEKKVILTGLGNTLCLDSLTGVYFKCDVSKIDRAVNTFNKELRDETFKELNDFYTNICLPPCEMGKLMGVFIDRGYLDVSYASCLTDDNEPVLVLTYDLYPIISYNEYHHNII